MVGKFWLDNPGMEVMEIREKAVFLGRQDGTVIKLVAVFCSGFLE